MSTKKKGQFVPLRNVPIHMNVDGVTVVGEILTLSPSDITIVIKEPFSGFGTYLHVPHFAMCAVNWLATFEGRKTTAITEGGREQPEWLLRCLYNHACGKPAGWGVYAVGPAGWTRIEDGL